VSKDVKCLDQILKEINNNGIRDEIY